MSWALRFLGVGNSAAVELGSASAVVERDERPLLMIDCGQEALTAYLKQYGAQPRALFITHVHMDHVAGSSGCSTRPIFRTARQGAPVRAGAAGDLPARPAGRTTRA
jgi:ribonuclease BN (tRNA processing enzyme)